MALPAKESIWLMAAFLLTAIGAFAQSQPPTPTPSKLSRPPEPNSSPGAGNPNGAEQLSEPASPALDDKMNPNSRAESPHGDAEDKNQPSTFERWNTGLTTFFTGLLVVITVWLGFITKSQIHSTHVIERAYVAMSHLSQGLTGTSAIIREGQTGPDFAELDISGTIKNYGKTPSNVAGHALCCYIGEKLPETPDYGGPENFTPSGAYLMPDGIYTFAKTFREDAVRLGLATAGKLNLWIFGYVDYTDRFKKRHHGGYARRWIPGLPAGENNLVIEATPGYNYDKDA